MRIIDPDSPTRRLLDRYEKAGGVLEFVMIDIGHSDSAAEDLHKKTAAMAYSFVQRIHHQKLEGIVGEERFCGRPIAGEEFWGPLFDQSNRRLMLKNAVCERERHGFAYAFSAPPHRLQTPDELFAEVYRVIFKGFPAGTEFWEWKTGDLRYFDDGREWWGTYFWTVRPAGADYIVAILGSTTD